MDLPCKSLLEAQAQIWSHIFSFLKSMALKCAIELGIPDAIQKYGKPITLIELANLLAIHPTKTCSLHRLMRLLCQSKFFTTKKLPNGELVFNLNTSSQLLLKDHPFSQAPFLLAILDPIMINPVYHFGGWFKNDQDSPFHMVHGTSIWGLAGHVNGFNESFNQAMACDARLVASMLVSNKDSRSLFEGLESLVDVGGGDGTMARAIAKAFPEMNCIVLDLPHVVEGQQKRDSNNLVYVGGDMFQAIPSANAVLLKWILHDWSDEHCLKILQQCKKAIPNKHHGGKVIIIDMVVGHQTDGVKHADVQILFDLELMSLTFGGKERTEEEWKKLFFNAGFSYYEIFPILGVRSVIVVYFS